MPADGSVRVLLDGFGLEDGSEHRGIGTYLRNLLSGLAGRSGVDVTVLASRAAALPPGIRRAAAPLPGPARWHSRIRATSLPFAISHADADIFHSPAQLPPSKSTKPWVQTLFDLTPLVYPDPLLEVERQRWLRIGPRIRSARTVICPSRSSADQAVRFLGLEPSRIEVIPLGIGKAFAPTGPREHRKAPYLLWVSSWGPHKGLEDACAAIAKLADAGYPHTLLAAGRQDPYGLDRMRAIVAASGRPDRVQIAGYVPDLGALYRGAAALLVTSRAEGFGLPVVEAFACGTPVVAYDNTSLTEVVGDGGRLAPDGDVARLVDIVREVIDDPGAAADLGKAGLRRAGDYSWESAVAAHIAVYRAVAES